MSVIMGAGALLLILAIGGHWLWCSGYRHGLGEGMLAGYDEGDRDGWNRGYSQRDLDLAEAEASRAEHNDQMLRMVGPHARPVQDEDIQRLIDGIPAVSGVLRSAGDCGAVTDQGGAA